MLNNKLIVLIFCCFTMSTAVAQLSFKTNKFSKNWTQLENIDLKATTDLGISIPIDEKITKFDKIVIDMEWTADDGEWGSTQLGIYWYLPSSKSFPVKFEDKESIDIYLIVPEGIEANGLGEEWRYQKPDAYTRKFRVVVKGYFENGEKTEWDDNSKSYLTSPSYQFTKNVYTSEPYTFKKDDAKLNLKAQKVESDKNFDIIKRVYTAEKKIPVVGYTQPKKNIYDAYRVVWNHYALRVNGENFDLIIKVEEKLIEIKEMKLKDLNQTLEGKTDPAEISKIILDYQVN